MRRQQPQSDRSRQPPPGAGGRDQRRLPRGMSRRQWADNYEEGRFGDDPAYRASRSPADDQARGEGGGRWRGGPEALQPGARRRYREEEGAPYGGPDYDSDPFGPAGSERGSYGERQDIERGDESGSYQGAGPRSGFGRGGQSGVHRGPPGHWGADQGDLRSPLSSSYTTGYGVNAAGLEWSDVARDRKGPRGYARSDERIREFICERLTHFHQLEVSDVGVEVAEGRVTLEGTVPDRRTKYVIEETADNCWGVRDVDNRIRVVPPGSAMQGGQGSMESSGGQPRGWTQGGQGATGSSAGQGTQAAQHAPYAADPPGGQGARSGSASAADPQAVESSRGHVKG